MDNIFYSIRNGKNPKYSYYLKSYFLRLLPLKAICRKRLNKILAQANTRSDKNYSTGKRKTRSAAACCPGG